MNIFEQYGIKEVMNACLYAIELDENENEVYVPVLYLDTLKVSTVEQSAQSVSAQGGLGNPKLITWDYGKDIKVQLEDALFTPAQQSMTWTGKLGAKGLKLYLRNFEDKTQPGPTEDEINQIIDSHPEWVINLPQNNWYLAYKEWLNKHTKGATLNIEKFSDFCIIPDRVSTDKNKYVGGTSIFCWLCDGYVIANDNSSRVVVDDLILFFREQTQKWYFFNGGGVIKQYKDQFNKYDYRHYGIGYQYGKDTFQWIKDNIAREDYELRTCENNEFYFNTIKNAPVILKNNEVTLRGNLIDKNFIYYENNTRREEEIDFNPIRCENFYLFTDSDNEYCVYSWLLTQGIGTSEHHSYVAPQVINNTTPGGGSHNFFYDDVANRWYIPVDNVEINGTSYYVCLPISEAGENYQNMVNYVLNHYNFSGGEITVELKKFDWEPVSAVTREAWGETIDKIESDSEKYDQVNFLTQNLYIDGYKINECAKSLKYSEDIEAELETTSQPCRYEASINVEYNTNIAYPQEALFQIENGFEKVDLLERIEKCTTKIQFCINTDTNTKHAQQRFLSQYSEKELTVYLNPKTMQPYIPNGFEYITKDNRRITGNVKIFKPGETYYKWSRTKSKRCESLGSRLTINAQSFPGVYKFVGETMIRDRDDGKDYMAQFEIAKCKLTANNNIQLHADGEPTTFNMELEALQTIFGDMMKITYYEVADKKCNGSADILPQFARPDFEEVNATWSIQPEFEVDAPETIDFAEILLGNMNGINKQHKEGD